MAFITKNVIITHYHIMLTRSSHSRSQLGNARYDRIMIGQRYCTLFAQFFLFAVFAQGVVEDQGLRLKLWIIVAHFLRTFCARVQFSVTQVQKVLKKFLQRPLPALSHIITGSLHSRFVVPLMTTTVFCFLAQSSDR